MNYKHTQISYLMLSITFFIVIYFIWLQITSQLEIPSYDSGTNLGVSIIMFLIIFILSSFCCLTVTIEEKNLKIKFWYGIFVKKFNLDDIVSIEKVKNHWYNWWWIRVWFWPYMWIYNISWFDAIELRMKNWKIYRIWTDDIEELTKAIKNKI